MQIPSTGYRPGQTDIKLINRLMQYELISVDASVRIKNYEITDFSK